ncbi:MAG: HINT domain-containing protein, partial [Chloroflexales bacterium]|nr:HINT domain-containing protein [Chloroflexales bacterium]
IEVGDTVLAYHEPTRETGVYPVTATWGRLDPVVVRVTLADETLTTTPEHPFFILLRGWVTTADLRPGDAVCRVDGSYGRMTVAPLALVIPYHHPRSAQGIPQR